LARQAIAAPLPAFLTTFTYGPPFGASTFDDGARSAA